MKSADPPRPARAAPASKPVASVASSSAGTGTTEPVPPLPTESAATSRTSADASDGRKESIESSSDEARKKPEARSGGAPREAAENKASRPQAESPGAPAGTGGRDTTLSPSSLLAPRGFRRRADSAGKSETGKSETGGTETGRTEAESGATAVTEVKAEEAAPAAGLTLDVLASTASATATAGTASAGAQQAAGKRGARALLRGSHRAVLTVAAVTGVVLVAGVLVGLRGGGSSHDKAAEPDVAASMLEAGADGGSKGGVPGALPLPTKDASGASPEAKSGGHDGHDGKKGGTQDGKQDASAPDKGSAHDSSSGSSSAHGDGKSEGGDDGTSSSSSGGGQPAAQETQAPADPPHTSAPVSNGGSGDTAPLSGVMVFSHDSGRCIGVYGGVGKDGRPLEIRDCSASSAAQRWSIRSDGTIRAFGLCMDAAGASTSNGTVVQLATCNGGPAQHFELNYRHDLVSILANKCVDVTDGHTGNGSRLQLWDCNGHDNQKWSRK